MFHSVAWFSACALPIVALQLHSSPDRSPKYLQEGSTWLQEYGDDPLSHPYISLLYLGTDHAGDLLPSRALREKYSTERRDVGPPGEEDDDDANDDGVLYPFGI